MFGNTPLFFSARGIVANKMRKKKVKTMYSDKKFNELINSYYEYKDQHPYRGAEWRANGENARACVGILTQIGEQIRQLINDENLVHGHRYEVYVSQGVGCFPRLPWVGFLFSNERPTHGVYPVFGFFNNDAGCYFAFSKSFEGEDEFANLCDMANVPVDVSTRWNRIGFSTHGRLALSDGLPMVKTRDERIAKKELAEAIRSAFNAYVHYRGL